MRWNNDFDDDRISIDDLKARVALLADEVECQRKMVSIMRQMIYLLARRAGFAINEETGEVTSK